MKISPLILAAALLAIPLSPAAARDWGNVSGWYVSSGENSCGLYSSEFAGPGTEVVILKRLDGNIYLQANNLSWALGNGWEASTRIEIDGQSYGGVMNVAPLSAYPGRGMIIVFSSDLEADLRRGKRLSITVNGLTLADISLGGSSAALAVAQSCLDELRSGGSGSTASASTAAASAGFETISAAAVTEAKPKGSPGSWIEMRDYPSSALRDRREGTTSFRLTIGSDGRVDNCEITSSSGHADLDAATCTAMTRRARFTPARGANGLETTGSYDSRVVWKVPG
ncbi:energy transducer TonB [Sphingorhabdus arenilitoris]|uniref:Energy transducer TonB n=1 Tax=Sphingorhabdus arenilitoris TaxID=1490041 RepID=A0ABV8RIS9_9SPHN